MTADETETDGRGEKGGTETTDGANEATAGESGESVLDRLDAFPWPIGVVGGAASFLASYLLLVLWVVVGPASLPGSFVEQLKRVGFLLYNAQGVLVVADTGPNTSAIPVNLLAQASFPMLYRALPAVVLLLGSAAVTYRWWVDDTNLLAVLATGAAVALGYLLVGLVGTYVFVIVQQGVPFHPARPDSFLFLTGYGLLFGLLGSMIVRARGKPT